MLDYSDATHGENIRIAEFNGLLAGLQGLEDNWIGSQNATRGECAQVLWNLLVLREAHNRWTDLAPALTPTARANSAMVWLPTKKILLFGGSLRGDNGSIYWENVAYLYDPATNLWSKPAATLRPWSRAGATMIYSPTIQKVIILGGIGGKGMLNDTWSYDPFADVWTELSPAGAVPAPRFGYAMAAGNTSAKLCLFGGYDTDASISYGDTWEYDTVANTWTELHPAGIVPSVRYGAKMEYDAATKKIYLFGGIMHGTQTNETWTYDPAANTWTQLSPSGTVPSGRSNFSFARHGASGRFILFGGYGAGGTMLNDTCAYDPVQNSWTALDPLNAPPARYQGPMVCDHALGYLILFGRIAADNNPRLADTWKFTP